MLHFGECNELHLSQCADKTTTTRASWWYLSHFGILSTNSDSQEHHGECKSWSSPSGAVHGAHPDRVFINAIGSPTRLQKGMILHNCVMLQTQGDVPL